jgi:hypothetical protein
LFQGMRCRPCSTRAGFIRLSFANAYPGGAKRAFDMPIVLRHVVVVWGDVLQLLAACLLPMQPSSFPAMDAWCASSSVLLQLCALCSLCRVLPGSRRSTQLHPLAVRQILAQGDLLCRSAVWQ